MAKQPEGHDRETPLPRLNSPTTPPMSFPPKDGKPASAASRPWPEDPLDVPSEEVLAAADELFKQQTVGPPAPEGVQESPRPSSSSEEDQASSPAHTAAGPGVKPDYLRELQQEFEEQQEEGKI